MLSLLTAFFLFFYYFSLFVSFLFLFRFAFFFLLGFLFVCLPIFPKEKSSLSFIPQTTNHQYPEKTRCLGFGMRDFSIFRNPSCIYCLVGLIGFESHCNDLTLFAARIAIQIKPVIVSSCEATSVLFFFRPVLYFSIN